jgi:hypothetical protein
LENKYILFTYSDSTDKYIPFLKYLRQKFDSCFFFSNLIQSYSHLLNAIQPISCIENNICLLSLSSNNIFYGKENIPIIFSIENAFSVPSTSTMEQIMNKISLLNNFSYQPIEIHLLYFLYKSNSKYLSITDLIEVINHYLLSMPFFSLFTEKEKEKYSEDCMNSLQHFVSYDFSFIFKKIVEEDSCTWNNFSLSMLYYIILVKINRCFPSNEFNFFKEWSKLLLENLNGNAKSRKKVENTRKTFDQLFIDYPHWIYIKKIDNEKMDLLWKEIIMNS